MQLLKMKTFNHPEVAYEKPGYGDELEKVTEVYLEENGGKSLGNIDTPSFIRKVANVTLMPPQEWLRRKVVLEPDEKILDLINVLAG